MLRRADLLYPDLSFKIVGVLIDVYKQLGPGHQERYYQKAVAVGLQTAKIHFIEQYCVPLKFNNVHIGKYFIDFLIEDKIILELKKSTFIPKSTFDQVKGYLTSTHLDLAIIANLTLNGVLYKRVIATPQKRH